MSDNVSKNSGGLDEFMRKSLEDHRVEPDPGLWRGISRKLLWRELSRFNFTNLSWKFRTAGIAGLMILAGAVYFLVPGTSPKPAPAGLSAAGSVGSASPAPVAITTPSAPAGTLSQPAASPAGKPAPLARAASAEHNPPSTRVSSTKRLAYANNLPAKTVSRPIPAINDVNEPLAVFPAGQAGISHDRGRVEITHLDPYEAGQLTGEPRTDTIITIRNANGVFRVLKTGPGTRQFFSANFGVIPEMAFYAEPEAYSKVNVWLEGGITWHVSKFSVAVKPGLGYVYDQGRYNVEYKSNDSVGYFTNVISYTIGSNNEIIYNTVTKSVYDSLIHQDDYRTMNRYTYLQIPLLFGYRFYESSRMSLTLQAGPAVSFLLGSRKSDAVIEYPDARIIRVDDNTPARVNTNWQVWGDLLLEIRMTRKFSFYIEPSCKYFLNPMIQQENGKVKAPWSVGLGIGLQYNFAPKKKNP